MAWSDISDPGLEKIYDELTQRKRDYLRGDQTESGLIEADQLHDQLESAQEEAEMETRNDLVSSIYETSDITQAELAEAVGLSRSRVADILSS
jgi:DNA-directed RNA polymerase specialized sigma subunit